MRRISNLWVALCLASMLILFAIAETSAERSSGEDIDWQVVSSGGTEGSSASYNVAGTLGQTATGPGGSATYGINQGYWQDFGGGGGPDYVCGDADGNGIVEISDAVHLINYIFVPGSPAPDPLAAGDADCNTIVEITDAVYLISYVFVPGSAPPCDTDNDGEPDC